MLKRIQFRKSSGEFGLNLKDSYIVWSNWFHIPDNSDMPKWQERGKLLNEYKNE